MTLSTVKELAVGADNQNEALCSCETLMRSLVSYTVAEITNLSPRVLRRTAEGVDEIIFETDIDGVHYYLVRNRPEPPESPINLSPRELTVARLIAQGLPNKCIGDILEISPWTVATHLRRIYTKLSVTSRAAMVSRLVEGELL